MSFADERRAYLRGQLGDDAVASDPLATLSLWIKQAQEAGDPEATTMNLATVDPDGQPVVRPVLCKGVDEQGVSFYTNLRSRKGTSLAADPRAAVSFWWPSSERTVRIVGKTKLISRADVDAYFVTRPPGSRLGAYASHQSQPIERREQLDAAYAEVASQFAAAPPATAPEWWGGYTLIAYEVELWQGRADRLHDRLRFTRSSLTDDWAATRLQP